MKVTCSHIDKGVLNIDDLLSYFIGGFCNLCEYTLIMAFYFLCTVVHSQSLHDLVAFYKTAKTIDTCVDVVLDLVKVAFVFVSDLLRDLSSGYKGYLFSSNVQWVNKCIH